ncbi:MAG: ROK family protein [Actinobacteria bacterium]|nr:ROK family protein [Actinomycetota bacterium]
MPAATIGVDVGGTKILGVALDGGAEVVGEWRVATPPGGPAVLAAVSTVVERLRAGVGEVAGLGVGVPGLVDRHGTLRFAPNLPGVVELPVGPALAETTGLPVQVDNDATCALWAEHRAGAAGDTEHALLVTLGTGIGGGILADGRLLRGASGFAGEIGHLVVEAQGRMCGCGRRGCWERYASGSALSIAGREAARAGRAPRLVALAGGDADTVAGAHVVAAAAEGDAEATALVEAFAAWVAVGLASLVHVLDVDRCVIGGGLVEAGEVLFAPVRRAFRHRLVAPDHRPDVQVVAARLGERAGAIGAALLAREPAPAPAPGFRSQAGALPGNPGDGAASEG